MQDLLLGGFRGERPDVLFLGAHSDDIEIGCGGTILRIREQIPDARIHWVVFSAVDERRDELRASALRFLGEKGLERVHSFEFRDGFFPWEGERIKETFETLRGDLDPDLIFTHHLPDRHQDHRLVAELTWNTWRDHVVLEYEVPKYEGDLGQPNLYVPLGTEHAEGKIEILNVAYGTQLTKPWFDAETFRSLMRLRGVESRTRFAEAFHARKLRLGF